MTVTKSSSSTSSTAYTTASSSKRLSGLVSGLDTDTLVQQLTIGMQNKIDKQMQNKQIAQWRQSSYREVSKALTEFKTKYFSSTTSSSSILSSNYFTSSQINNTSSYLNVSGSASAAKNMVVNGIQQLAVQASYTSGAVSNKAITTGDISTTISKVAGQSITINYDNKDYTLTVSSGITDGNALIADLNNQIANNADLKNTTLKFTGTGNDKDPVTLSGDKDIKIVSGGTDLLASLGFSKGSTGADSTGMSISNISTSLQSYLEGSTLTFDVDGLKKTISFDLSTESNPVDYSTPDKLATYLQSKLDTAYGSRKISVGTSNGGLSISTGSSDASKTSVVTLVSSSKTGVLGTNGALKVYAGETNRLDTNRTLADLSSSFSNTLESADSYTMNVNGKDFTFKSTDKLSTVMNTINNDADANVTMTYSSVTDTFSIVAKNGGSSSQVKISDTLHDGSKVGNLATALFGGDVDSTSTTSGTTKGQDAIMYVSFNGNAPTQITRSDNSFTLDGVNFELTGTNMTLKNGQPVDKDGNPANNVSDIVFSDAIKFTSSSTTDDLYKKISDFVTDYNNILSLAYGKVIENNKTDGETYAPLTDAQKKEMSESQITAWETKAKKGILQNDSILSNLVINMRSSMTDQVSSIQSALYEIGISTKSTDYSTTNGQLTIDEDKLKAALTSDPDKVAALFTSSDGIATKLQKVIDANISTSSANPGLIYQKAGSDSASVDNSLLAKNITDYTSQIKTLQTRMETQQEYYYSKFTKLEQYMSQMNSQSSFFTSASSGS